MMNLHHPDDERLSALSARDDDATADAALTSHVASCARCTDLMDELGALRVSLAGLPDLRPHRPLQLLPPVVDEHAADGAAGWIRRIFGPVLAAGAALTLVGVIGTTGGVTEQIFQDVGSNLSGGASGAEADSGRDAEMPAASDTTLEPAEGAGGVSTLESQTEDGAEVEPMNRDLPAERSPWPMVLFTGVALMIGIALLRWILVPRAG